MLQLLRKEVPDLAKNDPLIVLKYTVATVALSLVGRSILIGVHDGAGVPNLYAQFAPTLPMLLINFMAYKYVMGQPKLQFRSHIGARWSKAYLVEFVIGHSAFTFFAVWLGYNYVAVSTTIGVSAFVAGFAVNVLVFGRQRKKTNIAAPPSLAQ